MAVLNLKGINGVKNLKKFFFSSREVIEIQSSFYYAKKHEKDSLGFSTQAETYEDYASQVYKFIHILYSFNMQEKLEIVELGGGTGKFCQDLTRILDNKALPYTYTLVDVSLAKYEKLRKKKNIKFSKKSFEEFSKKNKKKYDILIMKEAVDMWAGEELLLERWDNVKLPFTAFWVVVDKENNMIMPKKAVLKVKDDEIDSYTWKLLFFDQNTKNFVHPSEIGDYKYKIRLPDSFFLLLKKIDLFSVVHDYWVFESDPNPIRSFESVERD